MIPFRVGIGFDAHPLVEGRPLILGGVEVPFGKGLDGYSDADVLAHAVIDALLGAAALGDIGLHFPPGDSRYAGISSLELIKRTLAILGPGYQATNIDSTVCLQAPRLADFIPLMRERLAETLSMEIGEVSVKATTTDHLGFVGRGEGAAAMAVVLLRETAGAGE